MNIIIVTNDDNDENYRLPVIENPFLTQRFQQIYTTTKFYTKQIKDNTVNRD